MKKEINIAILFLISIILIISLYCFEIVNAQSNDKIKLKNEIYKEPQNTNISGKIDSYTFSRNIPKKMTIGKPYKIIVFVKNTGERSSSFLVILFPPSKYIQPRYDTKVVALDAGESRRIEFLITPIMTNVGELNITAKLYLLTPSHIEIDSVSSSVFLIEREFSTQYIIKVFSIIVIIISSVALIVSFKRVRSKGEVGGKR